MKKNCEQCGAELVRVNPIERASHWRHKPYEACEPRYYNYDKTSRRTKFTDRGVTYKKVDDSFSNATTQSTSDDKANLSKSSKAYDKLNDLKIPYGIKKDGTRIAPSEVCMGGKHRIVPGDIFCPDCKRELAVYDMPVVQKHFRHRFSSCKPSMYYSDGSTSRRVKSASKRVAKKKASTSSHDATSRHKSNNRTKASNDSEKRQSQTKTRTQSSTSTSNPGCSTLVVMVSTILVVLVVSMV